MFVTCLFWVNLCGCAVSGCSHKGKWCPKFWFNAFCFGGVSVKSMRSVPFSSLAEGPHQMARIYCFFVCLRVACWHMFAFASLSLLTGGPHQSARNSNLLLWLRYSRIRDIAPFLSWERKGIFTEKPILRFSCFVTILTNAIILIHFS